MAAFHPLGFISTCLGLSPPGYVISTGCIPNRARTRRQAGFYHRYLPCRGAEPWQATLSYPIQICSLQQEDRVRMGFPKPDVHL